jgi:hypothetical protein
VAHRLVVILTALWLSSPVAFAAERVNVRAFGARGDGQTDDTAAISKAIGALKSGSTLYFECGTYSISARLTTITATPVAITGPPNCVVIKTVGGAGFAAIKISGGGTGPKIPLLSDAVEQERQFTADLQRAGIREGDYAVLSDNLPGSAGGNVEVVQVTSISGQHATTAGPVHVNFLRANGATIAKLENPITATVSNLRLDGSSSTNHDSEGLSLVFAVNSSATGVTAKDFAQAALVSKFGYNNVLRDIRIERAGSPDAGAVDIYAQNAMTVQDLSVINAAKNGFGVVLHQVHASTLSAISVAQNGAPGRAFKLYRSCWNTVTGLTVTGTGGEKNGLSVTLGSSHNVFANVTALNNSGLGIATFGDGNAFNTFIRPVSKYNTRQQFFQVPGSDDHLSIRGGDFCCSRGHGFSVVTINSNDFSIDNAQIWDDQGLAISGLSFGASLKPTVTNNRFRGFPSRLDIDTGGARQGSFLHNVTPDGVSNPDRSNTVVP